MANKLRLKTVNITGFKSLESFEIAFDGNINLMIGPNGAGKSTVLQFFSFLHAFILGEPQRFFDERGWNTKQIRGFFSRSSNIIATLMFESDLGEVIWHLNWGLQSKVTRGEWLQYKKNDETVTVFRVSSDGKQVKYNGQTVEHLRIPGSVLAVLDLTSSALDPESTAIVKSLEEWGTGIFSLELMSPAAMRRGTRVVSPHIGHRGELLAGFLASLNSSQKSELVQKIGKFFPSISKLNTTRKRAGWVDLKIAENFPRSGEFSANHISDGLLRIIALISISEFALDTSLILLDEVEDGIDPHILPGILEDIQRESSISILMTSHSPILVNLFPPESISFVARTDDGPAVTARFDEIREIQKDLEFEGTGEIWLHTSPETIKKWVISAQNNKPHHDAISEGSL